MVVKKLSIDEIPQLIKLYDELMGDWARNETPISQKIYLDIVGNDDYLVLVAKDSEEIVGTAMGVCCKTLSFAGKNFLLIEDVIVAEGFKRKGVGRKLFEALDNFAAEKNCAYAILVSSGFRKGAHAFYEKMGYVDDVKGFKKSY